MCDVTTGLVSVVCTAAGAQYEPDISGEVVVWTDYRPTNGDGDIYAYDIGTGTETRLTPDPDYQEHPAISGDIVVYQYGAWAKDIRMYDLSTETEHVICENPENQYFPDVSGDRIVWTDYRNGGGGDIYMFDLSTGLEKVVCNAQQHQDQPAISGNRIVWDDYRGGYGLPEIYMREIEP
jgi:beta propeller repeat protein